MTAFEPRRSKEIYALSGRHDWIEDLWKITREEFEETYQEWKHVLGSTQDPHKVLDVFDPYYPEKFVYKLPNENSWTRAEVLLAKHISANFEYLQYKLSRVTWPGPAYRLQDRQWHWGEVYGYRYEDLYVNDWQNNIPLLVKLVFSSLLSSTNAFYSRKFAHLDDDTLALVPASTQIGDIVAQLIRDSQFGVPMILRPVQEEIDPVLDVKINQEFQNQEDEDSLYSSMPSEVWMHWMEFQPKEVGHFTFVGECFVEGEMGAVRDLTPNNIRSLKLLALH
jgi:hypothetical protein